LDDRRILGVREHVAMMLTRFLWTYLVLVVVFAFGFLCASMFTTGED
jgi:hypothetical protein